uniref:Uncharacterized protein n=1 Tax=Nelumbo nucifera TaxID=4432 RepID=A0A822YLK9_NELNU|nr:TPA_asm: hypothetical protein HUJ06_011322 [Nelumbo nucifera]
MVAAVKSSGGSAGFQRASARQTGEIRRCSICRLVWPKRTGKKKGQLRRWLPLLPEKGRSAAVLRRWLPLLPEMLGLDLLLKTRSCFCRFQHNDHRGSHHWVVFNFTGRRTRGGNEMVESGAADGTGKPLNGAHREVMKCWKAVLQSQEPLN